MKNTQRKTHILNTAIDLAEKLGYKRVTLSAVAAEGQASKREVVEYFKSNERLKNTIVRWGFRKQRISIVAQAVAEGHRRARGVPEEMRKKLIDAIYI